MYYTAEQIVTMAKRAEGFEGVPGDYWLAPIRSNAAERNANQYECVVNLMKSETLVM